VEIVVVVAAPRRGDTLRGPRRFAGGGASRDAARDPLQVEPRAS
jgi:hypothetical protein